MGSSSKTPSATTNTTKQELPAWLDTAAQDYMSAGGDVASRPYEAYTGDRIAGFGQDQANASPRRNSHKRNHGLFRPLNEHQT